MRKLFAVCFQDSAEPWGWAPVTEDAEAVLPEGPFFWSLDAATTRLDEVIDQAVTDEINMLRERLQQRYDREADEREKWEREGRPKRPGAYITGPSLPEPEYGPKVPTPMPDEAEIERRARASVSTEFSVQEYDVPDPPEEER